MLLLTVGLTACPPPEPAGPTSTASVTVPGGVVGVAVPNGQTVTVASSNLAALPPLPTDDFDFDLGALGINVNGVAVGGVTVVTVTVPVAVSGVRKLINGAWDPFTFDGTTGAVISADGLTISVALQDGGRGDNDGVANGRIVDPFAPITKVRGGSTSTTTTPTSTSTSTTVPAPPAAGCYQNSHGNTVDLYYTGQPGVLGDLQERGSIDGSCTGPQMDYHTLVFSTSYVGAGLECQALGLDTGIGNPLNAEGWTGFPTNAYYCPVSSPPVTTTTTTVPTAPSAGCYQNTHGNVVDFYYTGQPGVLGDLQERDSVDGSCTGAQRDYRTLVFSTSQVGAGLECQALGLSTTTGNPLNAEGWTGFPTNAYYCPVSSPPVTTTTTTIPTLTNPPAGCYDSAGPSSADVQYTGTPNVLGNAIFHTTRDGSCGNPFPGDQAIVLAFTESAAISICNGLGRTSAFNAVTFYQLPLPATTWICTSD